MTEHLLSAVREIALLPAEQRIARIRGDHWIGYGRAEGVLTKLEELFNSPKRIRAANMLIIGPTNNGKTMIVEKFRRTHLPYESEDGAHEVIPVLVVQMPSSPTIQRFYTAIMRALGSPVIAYPSTARNEAMALKMLGVTRTKMVFIDELHNILAGSVSKQREFLNLIRFIGNELQISIIGVGTRDAYLAIRSDDQLENRFEPVILPLWENNSEFNRLLASFVKILPLLKPSELLNHDIRRIILERSEGTIGEISGLLTKAASEAIMSGKEYIDQEVLERTNYHSPSERRRLYESMVH
ncbi:transposase [Rickettsiales endosymbiont of Peranema trichophorum]|uniref:TniB family NTP-binding protein n=1 Tax=Rickettsiales endosymbiont of Peranema trichophorum TaxID=2486577 RepID=UPI0010235F05|nr:TniB family NTP-binding protein [Rickettsiales endosymbiont of Peranema trichophorum]RZI45289.1 transposase [Rickettsiales endosymbiont of Peranema trichophorum]